MSEPNPNDEAVLRMMAGAHFGPGAKVILPSGREAGGDEMQALTSFYAPAAGQACRAEEPDYSPRMSAAVTRRRLWEQRLVEIEAKRNAEAEQAEMDARFDRVARRICRCLVAAYVLSVLGAIAYIVVTTSVPVSVPGWTQAVTGLWAFTGLSLSLVWVLEAGC